MILPKIQNKKMIRNVIIYGCVFMGGFMLHSWLNPKNAGFFHMGGEVAVSVQKLARQDLTDKKKFIASVEAINNVNIISQVSGYIQDVHFKDGAFVHEGDILFVIEQSKFKANVATAEADLEKAKSDLVQISSDYDRQKQLFEEKISPKVALEAAENKFNQAQATIKQAEANLTLAKINLGYTEIKAPISGYIGKVLVTKGNYVSPASTPLANIVQTDPIRIAFSVSDKDRLTFLKDVHGDHMNAHFEVVYPNGETVEVQADNFFADNQINADTATLPVYLDYQNPKNELIPGNYVDILVSADKPQKSLVVPMVALASDINGDYVMSVDGNNVVAQKYIKLGKTVGSVAEVLEGLSDNDIVIVQGLQKVQNGMTVKPLFAVQ